MTAANAPSKRTASRDTSVRQTRAAGTASDTSPASANGVSAETSHDP